MTENVKIPLKEGWTSLADFILSSTFNWIKQFELKRKKISLTVSGQTHWVSAMFLLTSLMPFRHSNDNFKNDDDDVVVVAV